MQGEVVVDPGQQVLAPADHLGDGAAGEVGRGELRHPEVGAGQPPAGERVVQAAAGQPDGVTLGHGVTIVSAAGGMMHPGRTLGRGDEPAVPNR